MPLLKHRYLWVALLFALAAMLVPASTTLATNEARPVLAYHYAWWDPSNLNRTMFQPDQAYNSDDVSIIQKHVQEAQSAGIDGFVMSWYANGDRTDTNLQAFYAKYSNNPALVRYQGRPVIFFWQAGTYDNTTGNAIRGQVDPDHNAMWIADGDQFGILSGNAWDGISPYAIAWSANPAAQLPSWGARAAAVAPNKLYIPPDSPGCNDSAARATTCARDRAATPGTNG